MSQATGSTTKHLKIYELIRANEPVTFLAESIQIAAIVALCLSRTHEYGAKDIDAKSGPLWSFFGMVVRALWR